MSKLDARLHYRTDREYVVNLVERAQAAAGSRNKLAAKVGISRRRLGYIESGARRLPSGRILPVTITFAEQITLERIIGSAE